MGIPKEIIDKCLELIDAKKDDSFTPDFFACVVNKMAEEELERFLDKLNENTKEQLLCLLVPMLNKILTDRCIANKTIKFEDTQVGEYTNNPNENDLDR